MNDCIRESDRNSNPCRATVFYAFCVLIFSLNTLLCLKASTSFGGMSLRCLVDGFTMTRSSFFFTSNVPKPETLNDVSSSSASAIEVAMAATSRCASLGLTLASAANFAIKSLLFTELI